MSTLPGYALLSSAWAKSLNARAHTSRVFNLIEEFEFLHGPRLFVQATNQDTVSLVYGITEPIPASIALAVGDALHNLRSALDHAACSVAVYFGGNVTRSTQFPFAKDREDLEAVLPRRIPGQLSKHLGDVLVNEIRPYFPQNGGNRALSALHELDIDDKHKILLPTYSASVLRVNGYLEFGNTMVSKSNIRITGGALATIGPPSPAGTELKYENVESDWRLLLGGTGSLASVDVRDALSLCVREVTNTLILLGGAIEAASKGQH